MDDEVNEPDGQVEEPDVKPARTVRRARHARRVTQNAEWLTPEDHALAEAEMRRLWPMP